MESVAASADRRGSAADLLGPLLVGLLGDPLPVAVRCWDGSVAGPDDAPGTLVVRSPDAVTRLVWAPGELGLARAVVAGDLDVEGELIGTLQAIRDRRIDGLALASPRSVRSVLRTLRHLDVRIGPLPPPQIEFRGRLGRRHSLRRDAEAISHHYDVSNDFYALVLGESMTYSCAVFPGPGTTLAEAQAAKHERVCRKLGLHESPGLRLLDVGCGWGSMAIHAAAHHDARVVGITISAPQARLARQRVVEAGMADRVEIRVQDYRELEGEQFDAISSIGMSEHVGSAELDTYFGTLHRLLAPRGRILNHAISSVGGSRLGRRGFMHRYVFPDGELIDVGETALAMQRAGFEIRDVESLREHYARTLRQWIANLEGKWDAAVAEAGAERCRAWRLYMAASAVGFIDGGVNVHQVLGVVPEEDGTSGMPTLRPL